MAKSIFITFFSTLFSLLLAYNNAPLAQVIDKGNSIIQNSESDRIGMNQLDFGFTVPDSSIIANVIYLKEKGFIAIDKDGNELFSIFPYDNGPDYISEGMFRIIENGLIGFASGEGDVVIRPVFKAVYPFHNGLAAFCVGCISITDDEYSRWDKGKWGFIDRSGKTVIPPIYDRVIEDFQELYATVEKDGTIITINKEGRIERILP
jgi:hypothetical protein